MSKYNLLKRLDKQLLINYPEVWASRAHTFIPLVLPINLLCVWALAVFPFTPAQFLYVKQLYGVSFVLPALMFFYYAYKQKIISRNR